MAYQAVQGHLVTWLHLVRSSEPGGDAVPAHVEREFRQYLTGGIPAHGFARARCAGCGYDFLVAFSCEGRGVCSACGTRRMAETTAPLVDQVFPGGAGAGVGALAPEAVALLLPAPVPPGQPGAADFSGRGGTALRY